ncbi:hypothetical protein Trydic_g13841 [Trypoxylus dichotomus]
MQISLLHITREKQELHDRLKDIIVRDQKQASFGFETDIALEFEDLARPQKSQFIESISEYHEDYERAQEGGKFNIKRQKIWRSSVRRFSDEVLLMGYDLTLHRRKYIFQLQSLTNNQLSLPKFFDLFKCGWYKSGYFKDWPPKSDVGFCFPKDLQTTSPCSISH